MSQPSSDAAGAAYRRKVLTKVMIFVALAVVIWLQPRIQAWLQGRNAAGSKNADAVAKHDSDPSDSSDLVRMDRDPAGKQRTSGRDSAANTKTPDAATTPSDTAQPDTEPVLGELREIRNKVFESTAGLRYVPGSQDNHRLDHVMQHAKDDTTKPIHGVFEGNRDQILAVIDEAYQKAQKGGRDVRSEEQNDRLVYTVNLGRKIGYMGGSGGERAGNPDCRYVRIVLEDGNVVISAYPTKSF